MLQLTTTERVHLGERISEALVMEANLLDSERIFLLVSSTLLNTTDEIDKVKEVLGDRIVYVHDGIPPHAPRSSVLAAAAKARASGADLIVTIGGGSVTDAGKIIPLILKHDLTDHDDLEPFHVYVNEAGETIKPEFESPDLRVICCPTTLSGGEFNPLAGATDEKIGHKQGFEHPMMAPVAVILDPELTRHTPAWLWTSTGVRSVDHALETLGSLSSDHFSDGIAESALKLLSGALPAVHKTPNDMDARLRCQIGAWQSMIPIIGGVPMGASHAIGHILGGTCEVPHGYCSCVMAPAVLDYNSDVNADRQRRISECFGRPQEAASKVLDEFISALGMPRSLSEVGVREDQLDHIAEYTMLDFWARTNPKKIGSSSDVRKILDLAI
ncbi:MAG: iron-containing alcohol dehydrogenase [Chloroflexota bacterium]|nr:iron-containing alcohol dehydrogenase [Chloroflexota bacterium]